MEQKTKRILSFLEREYLRRKSKVRLNEQKTKRILGFLEREYLRRKSKVLKII